MSVCVCVCVCVYSNAISPTFQLISCLPSHSGGPLQNVHSPVEAMNKCKDFIDRDFLHNFLNAKDYCVYWIYNPASSECYLSKSVPNKTPTPPEGSPNYRIMGGIC